MLALSPIRRLGIHTIAGTSLFALIGAAAVLLHHAIVFVEYSGMSSAIVKTFHFVELLLFATDTLSFVPFILLETYLFLRSILRLGVSHDQPVRPGDA